MSSPTDEQILKAKTNLRNLMDFNNQLYVEGDTKIINAFSLLSLSDNKDLGLQIGLNLLCGAFWALGGPLDAAGAIMANFACGVVGHYADSTPPSLNVQFSSLLTRFQKTSEQMDVDLELYYDNPRDYWDTTFSSTVYNPFGSYPVSGKLSDLATIDFPSKMDSAFMDYMLKAQYALDQEVWAQLLQNFKITKFYPSTDYKCKYYTEADMENDAAGFYAVHPSYWNNWVYHHETNRKGEDRSYYEQWQNNIGTGAGTFSDGHLNDNACKYMFIDSYDNVVINANGLFHRNFVFNDLKNITHTTHTYYNAEELSAIRKNKDCKGL